MRVLVLILAFAQVAFAEPPFDSPSLSSSGKYSALFSETQDPVHNTSGSSIKIKDRSGKTVFSDHMPDRVALGARWTDDGKFLVIPTANGGGHSPWHVHICIFSMAHHAIRWLDDSKGPPIVSSEVWSQAPDTIILVGHDFSHGIAAPEDPILLHYKVRDLWKKLK